MSAGQRGQIDAFGEAPIPEDFEWACAVPRDISAHVPAGLYDTVVLVAHETRDPVALIEYTFTLGLQGIERSV